MTRIPFVIGAVALSACTMQGLPQIGAPAGSTPRAEDWNKPGTCYAVVSKAEDGTYTLATGVGDGSAEPAAVHAKGLSAAKVDAAVAKEKGIMQINPECLSSYVFDRAAADPASMAAAKPAG
ncbi:hypothetical protein [Paenirhodobacter sp.]|uniref:hypothetical protein n=1 Tax=Paenirhodobacter sp. TaxID=1965326 RepID=UPI003B3D2421